MRRTLRPNSNCVDVGCHEGSILSHMLSFAPEGEHWAFEPLPGLAAGLRDNFMAPRVHVHELALADMVGESSFQHVVTNPGYSGLRERRYDRPHEERVEISVRVDSLDNIVPSDRRIDFIKIDVEGAELGVLRGGVQTLLRSQPLVVFEHGLGGSDYYGTEPEDVYDLLAEVGLSSTLMERLLAGQPPLSREEFGEHFRQGLNYYFAAYPG
jgi:FkbM family methyltransferase